MNAEQPEAKGPDLTQGVALNDVSDGGMLGGHVGDEAVLLARRGDEFFAIGATCSHYGGPLAEGLVVGRLASLIATASEYIDEVDQTLTLDGLRLVYERNCGASHAG